ncbi:MAG: flagellar hook-length control protein FliK [Desulfobacteraceae bacterium]|nr:flagellar hook-length control protein FliK [Desulfobacteraceae bacterium]
MEVPFLNPMMPAGLPAVQGAAKTANLSGDQDFAQFMDRRLNEESGQKDLLGVARQAPAASAAKGQPAKESGPDAAGQNVPAVAGLLQQFMQKLQALSTDTKNGPGQWSFAPPDAGVLQKLATDAGMSSAETAALLQRLQEKGKLPLEELFAALAQHFANLSKPDPVNVAETRLPLLESILSRLGVGVDQLQKIESQAVAVDGKLDLGKFLQALEGLPQKENGPPVVLSDDEADQLQSMLGEAGVTLELQQAMLPERGLSWNRGFQPESPVNMSLGRLESMLRQAITQVNAQRPQTDLPAFFADMNQVLVQSGFNENGAGWSPAVQGAVRGMYEQLLASVDLAGVRIEAPPPQPKLGQSATKNAGDGKQAGEGGLFGAPVEDAAAAFLSNPAAGGNAGQEGNGAKGEAERALMEAIVNKAPAGVSPAAAESFSLAAGRSVGTPPQAEPATNTVPGPPLAPELQQQALNQIAAGVARGLGGNEQHFVLRLRPPELGDVKVEVLVKNDHVSLAFTMDDKRVKEALESNMGQFRDNLQKQGLVLGECMVSVDQQDSSGEAWERFANAWRKQMGDRQAEKVGGAPQELLARTFGRPIRESGFNAII